MIIELTKQHYAIIDQDDYDLVANASAWHVQIKPGGKKYAIGQRTVNGRQTTIRMHRIILGARPSEVVDHINGNGLDNRRANLRIASHVGNCRNRLSTGNKWGFKGVSLIHKSIKNGKESWMARICKADRKTEVIGVFDSAISAAKAYDKKAREYFGDFASLNFKG